MKPDRLILFAKAPAPGRVKTRLSPLLDAAAAAQLHTALVEDACDLLVSFAGVADLELCLDAPTNCWSEYSLTRTNQGDGDLGDRLRRAIIRTLDSGHRQVVVIGADSPGLPAAHLEALLDAKTDAALGPTADGGYYAIKCRRAEPAMFEGIRWSTAYTFDDTVRALNKCGFAVATGPAWFDVDEPSDVRALLHTRALPRHTAAWLEAHATLLRER